MTVVRDILDRACPYAEADLLPTVFGAQVAAARGGRPVVLFGAGSAGRELLPLLIRHGVQPACFCDNDPSRVGCLVGGLPVVAPDTLARDHRASLVVLATGAGQAAMRVQLRALGLPDEQLCAVRDPTALSFYTHLAQWLWSDEDLTAHEPALQRVYDALSDERSRDLFVARIALFVRGADYRSFRRFLATFSDAQGRRADGRAVREMYLQFNNDVLRLEQNEVLVDGGAFDGDSTVEFIDACRRARVAYGEVICYEPDPQIHRELQRNMAVHARVHCRPYGLWSRSETLRLATAESVGRANSAVVSARASEVDLRRSPSPADGEGVIDIEARSIDDDCRDAAVSLIKMDLEGAELEALRGARRTLASRRPKLVISAYHKRNDIFELIECIREAAPGYRFHLRHFSNWFGETMVIAIP
jgi:FkbM family methyltransferase